MRMLDLFSGIGGFSLAASWVWGTDLEIVGFCEIDKFCQKVLTKNFTGVPIYDDIKKLKGSQFGSVDIITGGFPCQSFSVAGKRKGKEDDRYLWPEMFRVIQEVKPRWVIGENVTGIIDMALDTVLSDLENEGYETQTFIIPACSQNAPHKRERVWIVANSINGEHRGRDRSQGKEEKIPGVGGTKRCSGRTSGTGKIFSNSNGFNGDISGLRASEISQFEASQVFNNNVANPKSNLKDGIQRETITINVERNAWMEFERSCSSRRDTWTTESKLGRVANGIPNRVDRLKGLGNAIVPQVATVIMQAIKHPNI